MRRPPALEAGAAGSTERSRRRPMKRGERARKAPDRAEPTPPGHVGERELVPHQQPAPRIHAHADDLVVRRAAELLDELPLEPAPSDRHVPEHVLYGARIA